MTGSTTSEVGTPHGPVPMETRAPLGSALNVGVLLAHGAGAGRTHPWIVGLAEALAGSGFTVFTFDYAYMAADRRAPDRLPKLLDVHEAVASVAAAHAGRLVIAGKSMGGRVGGHLVADGRADPIAVAGLVYLGYPLVPIGSGEARDTSHLEEITRPQLFVSGTRDRMGPLDLLGAIVESLPDGRLVTIDDGDHSLVPRKATGRTVDDSVIEAVGAVVAWLADHDVL